MSEFDLKAVWQNAQNYWKLQKAVIRNLLEIKIYYLGFIYKVGIGVPVNIFRGIWEGDLGNFPKIGWFDMEWPQENSRVV